MAVVALVAAMVAVAEAAMARWRGDTAVVMVTRHSRGIVTEDASLVYSGPRI